MTKTKQNSPKYILAAELIKRRIAVGDYSFTPLPGAQKLSRELGISYLTVRQAIKNLIDEGVLVRSGNERLEIARIDGIAVPRLKVGFVHPVFISHGNKWFEAIRGGAERFGCSFSDILYSHPDDPVLYDALDGMFKPLFFVIPSDNPLFIDKLKKHSAHVITLFKNMTEFGIPRLGGIEAQVVEYPIRYLHRQGCRKIDFLASGSSIYERITVWSKCISDLKCNGELWVGAHTPPEPTYITATKYVRSLLAEGKMRGTDAIFCNNTELAMGCIRALRDYGIKVPEDIRIISLGNQEMALSFNPSITVIGLPALDTMIDLIFKNYLAGNPENRLDYSFKLADINYRDFFLLGESTEPNISLDFLNEIKPETNPGG